MKLDALPDRVMGWGVRRSTPATLAATVDSQASRNRGVNDVSADVCGALRGSVHVGDRSAVPVGPRVRASIFTKFGWVSKLDGVSVRERSPGSLKFDGLVPSAPAAATSRAAFMVFEWKLYTTMPLDDCFGLIVLFGLVRRVVHHRWHRKLWYQRGLHDASGNFDDDHHHRV